MELIDFTKCKEKPNIYLGSEKKKTIMYQDKQYLLKFPDPTRQEKNKLSYINNVYSEYIGCHVFENAGIPVQETLLGIYTTETGKTKTVCACRDFTNEENQLLEFDALFLGNVELEKPSSTDIEDILNTIETSPLPDKKICVERFFDMFVVDSIIGNTDRHNTNWGFLSGRTDGHLSLAPVYDCGSSLMPLLGDEALETLLKDSTELKNQLINTYSCLRLGGKRIQYSSFIHSMKNKECNKALLRVLPKINTKGINSMIEEIKGISPLRKEFYKTVIKNRYEQTLVPVYMQLHKTVVPVSNTTALELER